MVCELGIDGRVPQFVGTTKADPAYVRALIEVSGHRQGHELTVGDVIDGCTRGLARDKNRHIPGPSLTQG